MTVQCCKCKKIRQHGQWVDGSVLFREANFVSHTYCDRCFIECYVEIFTSEASQVKRGSAGVVLQLLNSLSS